MRHFSPSPTVRSSMVPLYMRGFPPVHLGQDDGSLPIDTTSYDMSGDLIPPPSAIIDTTTEAPAGGWTNLIPPDSSVTPAEAALTLQPGYTPTQLATYYNNAAAAGTITPAQAAAAIAQISKSATAGLSTAPSPRVSVPAVPGASLLSQSSIIKGVPDIAVLGIGLLAVFAMGK